MSINYKTHGELEYRLETFRAINGEHFKIIQGVPAKGIKKEYIN